MKNLKNVQVSSFSQGVLFFGVSILGKLSHGLNFSGRSPFSSLSAVQMPVTKLGPILNKEFKTENIFMFGG